VFVALADNEHQGIVPVPKKIGNGADPQNNLYWGAAAGVKTFFSKSAEWKLVQSQKNVTQSILERVVFEHKTSRVFVVADAYNGAEIRQTIANFLRAAAGQDRQTVSVGGDALNAGGGADLVVYVGHDGLMDFQLPPVKSSSGRPTIILACASKQYFGPLLRVSGAYPLLWTTNLMAPEAYTLKAALDGWITNESHAQIQTRAAEAYSHYQKCSVGAAKKLLVTGW
jgi:hypothetical protein